MVLMTTFSFCSTLNCLCLQLAILLIDSCDAERGQGGGSGFLGISSMFRGSSSNNGDDNPLVGLLETIILLLILFLAILVIALVYDWVKKCHQLVHDPEYLANKDPDLFQKGIIATYQALQTKFRNDPIKCQQEDNKNGTQIPIISTTSHSKYLQPQVPHAEPV